jgi:hypothetical protein
MLGFSSLTGTALADDGTISISLNLTGVSGSFSVGNTGVVGDSTTNLVGVSASFSVGQVPQVSIAISGFSITSSVGELFFWSTLDPVETASWTAISPSAITWTEQVPISNPTWVKITA